MNYILQLSGFFQKVAVDNRLNPTHVSLYMAVFQFWNAERFQNPVSISRQLHKIKIKTTQIPVNYIVYRHLYFKQVTKYSISISL